MNIDLVSECRSVTTGCGFVVRKHRFAWIRVDPLYMSFGFAICAWDCSKFRIILSNLSSFSIFWTRVHHYDVCVCVCIYIYIYIWEMNNHSHIWRQTVGTIFGAVWTTRSLMFFTVSKNTAKQLKLSDLSGYLTPMPKSVSERKVCLIHKIFSL